MRTNNLATLENFRPPTMAEARTIAEELTAGSMPHVIAKKLKLPTAQIHAWIDATDPVGPELVRARELGLETRLDELLEMLLDDETDVARLREYRAALTWIASKRNPKRYGDRATIDVNHSLSLREAMDEAANRRAKTAAMQQHDLPELERADTPSNLADRAPDYESVTEPETLEDLLS